MPRADKPLRASNIFLRMHPLHRVVISLVPAIAVWLLISGRTPVLIIIMLSWLAFSFTYLLISWLIMFTRPISQIKAYAKADDGSKWFVFAFILLSSFSSFLLVLLLITSKEFNQSNNFFFPLICVAGIISSWFLVHTTYTFHYAHQYYNNAPDDETQDAKGLDFPSDEEPDYIDFAYFAFVIGCCFQVSDVTINSRIIRRSALWHQLISFGLNTFVVALTINLIAGLRK